MYRYYQVVGGQEPWQPIQSEFLDRLVKEKQPMFVTVLSTDKIASKEMSREEKLALKYLGPFYVDFDSKELERCIADVKSFCATLSKRFRLAPENYRVFATGSKGFHVEIPMENFVAKLPKGGVQHLPLVYKRMALDMAEDTMDWVVYSMGMGRMWRQPNVVRPNGKYKVLLSPEQVENLTPEFLEELVSTPQPLPPLPEIQPNLELAVLFDKLSQDVSDKLKNSKKRKPVDAALFKQPMPSIELLMLGEGLKSTAGFNQIAMQLAIYARNAGLTADDLVVKCEGLCAKHQSDGRRYNTPEKRQEELRRMYDVIGDDPCYEFAAPPFRALLSHSALDLDGITLDHEDVVKDIAEAKEGVAQPTDEYGDLTNNLILNKHGAYVRTENGGMKRITGLGFTDTKILKTMESENISSIDTEVLINGRPVGRQVIPLDSFHTAANLNKFASKQGHAFNGTETHAKEFYMSLVAQAKKSGGEVYVHEREGLALVNIPHHANEALRTPFLLWSDGKKVVPEKRASETGVSIVFQGSPDPRGVYRCDLMDSAHLIDWAKDEGNLQVMQDTFENLFRCQRSDVVGPLLGWLTACFYKALFQKAYNKFPILHINGPAGSGKTEMSLALSSLFYYNQEPKSITPTSTVFALTQCASGSDSVPMIVDEYKPHEMGQVLHDRLKLMFRDAYNGRDVQRGGGNKHTDDYRALSTSTLCAPIMFIAEAMEEETALMERVVMVTVSKPPPAIAHRWASRFYTFRKNKQVLAMIGRYLVSKLLITSYTPQLLMAEFDPLYEAARKKYMLTEEDLRTEMAPEALRDKQAARERTVFNYTVALFGLQKFKEVLQDFLPGAFAEDFAAFEENMYIRMKDLVPSTVPEYLKVLNSLVDLSYEDALLPHAMRYGTEYAFGNVGGKDTLEISARAAYARYRQYCRLLNSKPLYSGELAFVHSLRGVDALMFVGESSLLVPGGAHVFDMNALLRAGMRGFKGSPGNRKK